MLKKIRKLFPKKPVEIGHATVHIQVTHKDGTVTDHGLVSEGPMYVKAEKE